MNQTLVDPEQFWKNITKTLTDEGMGWPELAELTGLSAQSMASARYLKSDIRTATLIRMCIALDRKASEFLEGTYRTEQKKVDPTSLLELAGKLHPAPAIALLLTCFSQTEQDEILNSLNAMAEGTEKHERT